MDLRQKWEQGIGRARARATLIRWFLYLSFSATIPILIYRWWSDQPTDSPFYGRVGTSTPFPFGQLIITCSILTGVYFLVRKYSFVSEASATLVPLPAPLSALRSDIDSLAEKMGLLHSEFTTLVDTLNFGMNPHVAQLSSGPASKKILSGNKSVVLVLPVGFLKLYKQESSTAKAILAHELAHVRQKDWQIWGLNSSYAEAVKNFALPVGFLFAFLGLFAVGQLFYTQHQLAASADNIRDYSAVIGEGLKAQAAMNSFTSSSVFGAGRNDLVKDPQVQIEEAHEKIIEGFALAGTALIAPFIQFLILRLILRMRAKSEELADLAAVAFVGAGHLLGALSRCGQEQSRWNLFTVHPPLRNRIKAIRSAVGDTRLEVPAPETQLAKPAAPPAKKSGPGFAALFTQGTNTMATRRLVWFCLAYYGMGMIFQFMTLSNYEVEPLRQLHNAIFFPLPDLTFAIGLVVTYRLTKNFWISLVPAFITQLCIGSVISMMQVHDSTFWTNIKEEVPFALVGTALFFMAFYLLLNRFQPSLALCLSGALCYALTVALVFHHHFDAEATIMSVRAIFFSYGLTIIGLNLWATTFRPESA